MNMRKLVKSVEGKYDSPDYCNVIGWDLYMEDFRAFCRLKHLPPAETWEFRIVCYYYGEPIVELTFDKEDEDAVKELIESSVSYKSNLALNGVNPFC